MSGDANRSAREQHNSGVGDIAEWYTPAWVLDGLGKFDLDPCAVHHRRTAKRRYFVNGLSKPWNGRVWLNPPYGTALREWLKRLTEHDNGVALVPARTDTVWFHELVFGHAWAVLFLKGRIQFERADGRRRSGSPFPSCLVAYGRANVASLLECGFDGRIMRLDI